MSSEQTESPDPRRAVNPAQQLLERELKPLFLFGGIVPDESFDLVAMEVRTVPFSLQAPDHQADKPEIKFR